MLRAEASVAMTMETTVLNPEVAIGIFVHDKPNLYIRTIPSLMAGGARYTMASITLGIPLRPEQSSIKSKYLDITATTARLQLSYDYRLRLRFDSKHS